MTDFKLILAQIILYSIDQREMALVDRNIHNEDFWDGEINAHSLLLKNINKQLGGDHTDITIKEVEKFLLECEEEIDEKNYSIH